MISIELQDRELAKLKHDLDNYIKHKKEDIKIIIAKTAVNIKLEAQSEAQRDTSNLAGSIFIDDKKLDKLEVDIIGKAEYAPYVEFGTGKDVFKGPFSFPGEVQEYAKRFKGRGVRKVNLKSRPFLFPAFFSNRGKMIEEFKKILGKK